MISIVPAIIPESFEQLTDTVQRVQSWSPEIQVDIVDGVFVPDTSWPLRGNGDIADLQTLTKDIVVEVDLMIAAPEQTIEAYARAGVGRIVVHLESVTNLAHIVALKQHYPFALGLSINNDTPLSTLTDVIGYADYVQLMGIATIGSQGQPFDERVLERITSLARTHVSLPISIDGSVNVETVPRLVQAGAQRLVSGSAILRASNPQSAYEQLRTVANTPKF